MNSLLWITAPYVAFTSFVLGHVWRYRTDQFGWTTRSSQIYESRLLRLSLQDSGSVYAGLLVAVLATLPPINIADRRRIAELAAQGPPVEDVGLEPFAMDPLTAGARR